MEARKGFKRDTINALEMKSILCSVPSLGNQIALKREMLNIVVTLLTA